LLLLLAVVYAVWDQLSGQLAEQRRVNSELKAAQEVQTILVAAEERGAPGYAVASVYRPASEVGGDFFQVIPLDGDGTLIVAGDVSGKGLRAAMAVSLIVGAVRTLAEQDSSPAAVLAGLNRRLIGRTQGGFATCCAVRIDPTGQAMMANAGHCQPYLDGREVELPAGLPLGLVEGMTYDEIAVAIAHGQQLTLVSDGVVEARNHHGELYGFERLSQLMGERPTAEHIANTAIDFGQDDDITVLTVTRLAAEPAAAMKVSGLSPVSPTPAPA
jgi:serine phosphatase RsbU (regulator of sigma subunit)